MKKNEQQTDNQKKPLNTYLLFFYLLLSVIIQLPFLFLPARTWIWIEAQKKI